MSSRQHTIIKVCGMRDQENVQAVSSLPIDWMGFIFYPPSKRWVGDSFEVEQVEGVKRVGVFVNEVPEQVIARVQQFDLSLVQLHGEESPEMCEKIRRSGCQVIKAFSVDSSFDFDLVQPYLQQVDYFLFDTKGLLPGGNGVTFDWNLLKNYRFDVPFLLSGGIGLAQLDELKTFVHPCYLGVDVNSQFEIKPGLKDIDQLKKFTDELRSGS